MNDDKDSYLAMLGIIGTFGVVVGFAISSKDSFGLIDILASSFAICFWWIPLCVHRKESQKSQKEQVGHTWKRLEELKSSKILNDSLRHELTKIHEAFENEIITEDELFSKLEPYFLQATKELNKKESQNKIDKINKAFDDGVLTEAERDSKLSQL